MGVRPSTSAIPYAGRSPTGPEFLRRSLSQRGLVLSRPPCGTPSGAARLPALNSFGARLANAAPHSFHQRHLSSGWAALETPAGAPRRGRTVDQTAGCGPGPADPSKRQAFRAGPRRVLPQRACSTPRHRAWGGKGRRVGWPFSFSACSLHTRDANMVLMTDWAGRGSLLSADLSRWSTRNA